MKPITLLAVLLTAALAVTSCAGARPPVAQPSQADARGASFWVRPADLETRDLFYGPWGRDLAPSPNAEYKVVEIKHTGVNPGLVVADPDGREWSVKQTYPGGFDAEGPVEVVVSRILSAVGYHQPPVFYLPAFTVRDAFGTRTEIGGRFRLKEPSLKEVSDWQWESNPFVGSREYQGLLVMLMMFNSTDMKNTNNSLYERTRGGRVERWYVVRDIGAALGDTNAWAPRKGEPEAFAATPFILGTANGHVNFAYGGWYKNLVRDRITPEDVAWACNLLARLTDKQWHDAFRAGGYTPAQVDRFVAAMRTKVAEGRAVGRNAN